MSFVNQSCYSYEAVVQQGSSSMGGQEHIRSRRVSRIRNTKYNAGSFCGLLSACVNDPFTAVAAPAEQVYNQAPGDWKHCDR